MTELAELKSQLRPQLHSVPTGRLDVPDITPKEARKGLILTGKGRALLRARSTSGEDRSARLYELVSLLRDAGTTDAEAFVLIRNSIWNKFKGRDDEVERLWEAVERSYSSQSDDGRVERGLQGKRLLSRSRSSTRLSTLLARNIAPSRWGIERVWGERQYGFVAGEPKTYKSTITTDLAVSLASGTPFLGHFPVLEPGPVLIVQEENTQEIQYGRFSRIIRERNMGGKLHSYSSGVLEFTPPSDCPIYSMDRRGFNFQSKKKRRAVEREVEAIRPVMVILDPLQMMMGDLRLRDEGDVAKALGWLNELQGNYNTGLMIVHHYHKRREDGPQLGGQRMLGSQALHAWLMCGMYIQRVHGSRLKVNREFRAFADDTPFEVEFESEDNEDVYMATVHEQMRTSKQQELLDVVIENPWKTAPEYAKMTGKSRRAIGEMLERMDCQKKKRRKRGEQGGRPEVVFGPPAKTSK